MLRWVLVLSVSFLMLQVTFAVPGVSHYPYKQFPSSSVFHKSPLPVHQYGPRLPYHGASDVDLRSAKPPLSHLPKHSLHVPHIPPHHLLPAKHFVPKVADPRIPHLPHHLSHLPAQHLQLIPKRHAVPRVADTRIPHLPHLLPHLPHSKPHHVPLHHVKPHKARLADPRIPHHLLSLPHLPPHHLPLRHGKSRVRRSIDTRLLHLSQPLNPILPVLHVNPPVPREADPRLLHLSHLPQQPNLSFQHLSVNPLNHLVARRADPRHLHLHHHLHHGGGFHHSDIHDHTDIHHHHTDVHHHHHHVPVAPIHHHVHHKPKSVFIQKTIIKKIREAEKEQQRNYPHRLKRELPQVAAVRLATDPDVKFNLVGTLDNVKDATKHMCEGIDSPVYHFRDAIGSARDVVFSLLKMSPTGLLIPSTYGIMEIKPGQETVGAINPAIYNYDVNSINQGDKQPEADTAITTNEITDANIGDTLTAVQFMLRNGFRKARDSAQHAGDAVHSMRRAVLTIPRSALKLILPYAKSIELEKDRMGFRSTGLLGKAPVVSEIPPPRLVGAGRLLELLRATASGDSSNERLGAPINSVKTAFRKGTENYKNVIEKIRNDVRERIRLM